MSEVIGFIFLMVGASGMDTEGNAWYIAAAFVIIGCLMMERRIICHLWTRINVKRRERHGIWDTEMM